MKTDHLIRALASDGAPIRRLESPDRRCLRWLGLAFAFVTVGTAVLGLRVDFATKTRDGFFLLENGALLALCISGARCAFQLSVPKDDRRAAFALPLLAASAWLSSVLLRLWFDSAAFELHSRLGLACIYRVLALGALPAAACLMAIRRAAPQNKRAAGFFASLAAFSIAEAGTQVLCAVDHPAHVLLWHFMPVLVLAGLGAGIGELALNRRPSSL